MEKNKPVTTTRLQPSRRRIAQLPTLVVPPPDGDLQLVAERILTTPMMAVSHGGTRSLDSTAVNQTNILTTRCQTVRKIRRHEHDVEYEDLRFRHTVFPQVIPNEKVQYKKEKTTCINDYRLPKQHETLPPLQNHCIEKKCKSTTLLVRLQHIRECSSSVIVVVPQLNISRRYASVEQEVPNVPTPPPTDRRCYHATVESATQTDDSFDIETTQIVEHLASSAIMKALESLQNDDEIKILRHQATNTKNLLEELTNTAKSATEEKDKIIATLQREGELRQCQCLATEICKGIVLSSMAHWNKVPSLTEPQTKSIGVDTRMLRSDNLMHVEIESDFFPWIFAKADRKYRRTKTSTELQDVVRRKKLLKRLKSQIC